MTGFILTSIILSLLIWHWRRTHQEHEARIEQLPIRIHVNGIRGKSTVTRLIAGVLREGGFRTVAKTTGSAARLIHEDGNESPIQRKGAATILEQIKIIKEHVKPETEALVIECMAVNPIYQNVSQHQIVKGNITIITNVREDHQDLMGHTLPEIADSLSNTIPVNGLLITAEDRLALREQLANNAAANGSDFLYADPAIVTDEDLKAFNYLTFKENLAIGLSIAKMLDIPHDIAMRGMHKAIPDIGAVFVQRTKMRGKEIVWAPLFAVNDRESSIISVEALRAYHKPNATRIGILNNRFDRAVRAIQFAEIAASDLKLDYYITFGAYEEQVTAHMVSLGYPRERIINLGVSKQPSLDEIIDQIAALVEGEEALLIGMVNIHTAQAELLMEYFHDLEHKEGQANKLIADFSHISSVAQRQRHLVSHILRSIQNSASYSRA
jgi:poly-gamma-glutamate synthase PgsB/CapB